MATFIGLTAIVLWGALALLSTITQGFPPFLLLSYCFVISTLLVVAKRLVSRRTVIFKPRLNFLQWLLGIIGLFGFHFCYFVAMWYAPVIHVSLIVYSWPLLLALFVSHKGNRWQVSIGGIIGFFGVGLLISNGADNAMSESESTVIGYLLAFVCALIWSSYSAFLARTKSEVDDIAWLSLVVALCAYIAHLTFEPPYQPSETIEWIGVVLLGIGPVGGAFYLWDYGLKKGNRSLLASLSFLAPVISSLLLIVAGLAEWTTGLVVSLICVVLGVVVSQFQPSRQTAAPTEVS